MMYVLTDKEFGHTRQLQIHKDQCKKNKKSKSLWQNTMLLIWTLLQRRNKYGRDESGSATDGQMKHVMPDLEKLIEDIILIIK